MTKSSAMDASLAEYRELRAEIRHYLERREKSMHFALILTTAVVGIGGELRSPFLFLISALFLAFLWYDETRRIMAVFRVAAYIELFIESKVKGLQWETLGGLHPIQTTLLERLIANGVFPIMFCIHAGYALQLADWTFSWKALILGLLVLVFFTLLVLSYKSAKFGRKREIKAWNRIKSSTT